MPTPKATSREEAERLIAEYKQSGLTHKQFCEKSGIKLGTFHWWMKRHNDDAEKKKTNTQPAFVSLKPTHHPEDTTCNLVIDFPSGTRLQWHGNTLPSSFYQLLSYFGGTPS